MSDINKPNKQKLVRSGDLWDQKGVKVVSTNLGGIHGRGLARQAKDKGFITAKNIDFKSSPFDKGVITLAVKGHNPESAKLKGRAFSERVSGKNIDLLKTELRSLIKYARENPKTDFNLPHIGLGFGEGDAKVIKPLLDLTSQEPNIYLVSRDDATTKKYPESFKPGIRKDGSSRSQDEKKTSLVNTEAPQTGKMKYTPLKIDSSKPEKKIFVSGSKEYQGKIGDGLYKEVKKLLHEHRNISLVTGGQDSSNIDKTVKKFGERFGIKTSVERPDWEKAKVNGKTIKGKAVKERSRKIALDESFVNSISINKEGEFSVKPPLERYIESNFREMGINLKKQREILQLSRTGDYNSLTRQLDSLEGFGSKRTIDAGVKVIKNASIAWSKNPKNISKQENLVGTKKERLDEIANPKNYGNTYTKEGKDIPIADVAESYGAKENTEYSSSDHYSPGIIDKEQFDIWNTQAKKPAGLENTGSLLKPKIQADFKRGLDIREYKGFATRTITKNIPYKKFSKNSGATPDDAGFASSLDDNKFKAKSVNDVETKDSISNRFYSSGRSPDKDSGVTSSDKDSKISIDKGAYLEKRDRQLKDEITQMPKHVANANDRDYLLKERKTVIPDQLSITEKSSQTSNDVQKPLRVASGKNLIAEVEGENYSKTIKDHEAAAEMKYRHERSLIHKGKDGEVVQIYSNWNKADDGNVGVSFKGEEPSSVKRKIEAPARTKNDTVSYVYAKGSAVAKPVVAAGVKKPEPIVSRLSSDKKSLITSGMELKSDHTASARNDAELIKFAKDKFSVKIEGDPVAQKPNLAKPTSLRAGTPLQKFDGDVIEVKKSLISGEYGTTKQNRRNAITVGKAKLAPKVTGALTGFSILSSVLGAFGTHKRAKERLGRGPNFKEYTDQYLFDAGAIKKFRKQFGQNYGDL